MLRQFRSAAVWLPLLVIWLALSALLVLQWLLPLLPTWAVAGIKAALALACGAGLTIATVVATEDTLLHLDQIHNRKPFETELSPFIDQQEKRFREGIRDGFLAEAQAKRPSSPHS